VECITQRITRQPFQFVGSTAFISTRSPRSSAFFRVRVRLRVRGNPSEARTI